VVQVAWDDTQIPHSYSLVQYVAKDGPHAFLSDVDAFIAITNENALAKNVLSAAQKTFPVLSQSGITPILTFTGTAPKRVLSLGFNGAVLTSGQANNLLDVINQTVHDASLVRVSATVAVKSLELVSGMTVASGLSAADMTSNIITSPIIVSSTKAPTRVEKTTKKDRRKKGK